VLRVTPVTVSTPAEIYEIKNVSGDELDASMIFLTYAFTFYVAPIITRSANIDVLTYFPAYCEFNLMQSTPISALELPGITIYPCLKI
jgi:hypothetical protein